MNDIIIKSVKTFDSTIDIETIEYSNNPIYVKDLISLYNLRLNIYNEKNASYEGVKFLEKKIHALNQLDSLNILSIKMVNVDIYIFYFDENLSKIYFVVNNITKEVKRILE